MSKSEEFVNVAADAARQAGALLREQANTSKVVDEMLDHDIKLELDVRCQDLITEIILKAFPDHAIYGEEGLAGNQDSDYQWIVDPIDGTVNFYFGIPHFCVSIAVRHAGNMVAGVIYDPMQDELFAVHEGAPATLNGHPISCSPRSELKECVVTVGFSKTKESMAAGMKRYGDIAFRVRKTRMLGSAALAMAYIACGRLDAYIEEIISLWDIAAGKMLVEAAGGRVDLTPSAHAEDKFTIVSSNGRIHEALLEFN